MRPSRRDAIKLGAAAGAALVADVGWALPSTEATVTMPTRTMFKGLVGEVFRVSHDGSPGVDLRLAHVADLACARATGLAGHEACFTAVFHGPLAAPLAQNTYRLWNRTLGAIDLFIVPGATDTQAAYVVTVYRVVPGAV